jgi:hypothetical protein
MKLLSLLAIILLFMYVIAACDSTPAKLPRGQQAISLEMPLVPAGAPWHTRLAATLRDDARLIISALAQSTTSTDNPHPAAA